MVDNLYNIPSTVLSTYLIFTYRLLLNVELELIWQRTLQLIMNNEVTV